jgi:uncharacterized repeat protein (TIGR02543 family)
LEEHDMNAGYHSKMKYIVVALVILFALFEPTPRPWPTRLVSAEDAAPVVTGVECDAAYYTPVIISFNEGAATIDGADFVSGTEYSVDGPHTLIVTGPTGQRTLVNFVISKRRFIFEPGPDSNPGNFEIDAFDGATIEEPHPPVRAGAVFNGWYTDGTQKLFVEFPISVNGSNMTLHADWIIIPDAPVSIQVNTVGSDFIRIFWEPLSRITDPEGPKFELAMSTGTSDAFKAVATIAADVFEYRATGLKSGTTYYFKVRAFVLQGTKRIYGEYSPTISSKTTSVAVSPTSTAEATPMATPGMTPEASPDATPTESTPTETISNPAEPSATLPVDSVPTSSPSKGDDTSPFVFAGIALVIVLAVGAGFLLLKQRS